MEQYNLFKISAKNEAAVMQCSVSHTIGSYMAVVQV